MFPRWTSVQSSRQAEGMEEIVPCSDGSLRTSRPLLVTSLAALIILAGACRSYETVSPGQAPEVLEPGDQLRVKLGDGRVLEFELRAVDVSPLPADEGENRQAFLVGPEDRIDLNTVLVLERKELSWSDNLWLVVLGVEAVIFALTGTVIIGLT